VTESEHHVRARDFFDGILEINRAHGEDGAPAAMEYEIAVETAVNTFRYLRENGTGAAAADPG
jgi:hypothetical protein